MTASADTELVTVVEIARAEIVLEPQDTAAARPRLGYLVRGRRVRRRDFLAVLDAARVDELATLAQHVSDIRDVLAGAPDDVSPLDAGAAALSSFAAILRRGGDNFAGKLGTRR